MTIQVPLSPWKPWQCALLLYLLFPAEEHLLWVGVSTGTIHPKSLLDTGAEGTGPAITAGLLLHFLISTESRHPGLLPCSSKPDL